MAVYQSQPPARPQHKSPWPALFALSALVLLAVVITFIATAPDPTPPTIGQTAAIAITTAPATPTPPGQAVKPAPVATFGAGTWEVGTEVKPGTYVTNADGPCYWARLKNFNGDFDSIAANGNLDPGGRGRITIRKTDKGLELSGGCAWHKV